MSKEVTHLVLRRGYVEHADTTVLILSKEDGSSFKPEDAAVELVKIVELSLINESNGLGFPADRYSVINSITEAYWGDNDSTGWHYEEMSCAGWTDCGEFPNSSDDCYIVHESAAEWLFTMWEDATPNWKDKRMLSDKERALSKLTEKDKKVLGLS